MLKLNIILKYFVIFSIISISNLNAGFKDSVKKTFYVNEGGSLIIETDLGSIDIITGNTATVQIEIQKIVKTWSNNKTKKILDNLSIQFRQDSNDIYIKTTYKKQDRKLFNYNRLRLLYVITVPKKYNVDLKTFGGSISVGDLEGIVNSSTFGGNIKIGNINGPVYGKTFGGSISLEGAIGQADAYTFGGNIKIGKVDGKINANTFGGSIKIVKSLGNINANTFGGSITASIYKQPVLNSSLTTSGGIIKIYIAKNIQADINAETSRGRVRSNIPVIVQDKSKKEILIGKINGGGPQLFLRTSNSNINIYEL